jgi:formaldehyde-activating enzyme involved in methanogenesis
MFSMQSDVAQAIAQQIKVNVTPQERQRLVVSRIVNPDAYEMLLRAQYHHNEWTRDGFFKAREDVERALAKDPDFALAHAWRRDLFCLGLGR